MAAVEVSENIDRDLWNALVSSVPQGTIYQTTYWGDYLDRSGYAKPFYFALKEGESYKGIMLLWIEPLTGRTRPGNTMLGYCQGVSKSLGLSYGSWQYGPLVLDRSRHAEILESLLKEVDRFARDRRLVFVRSLGSPLLYDSGSSEKDPAGCYAARGFAHKAKRTLFIDLSQGADAIWNGLGKYTRKDVKSCVKKGFTVQFLEKEELGEYNRLIAENRDRLKAPRPPYYPQEHMWTAMRRDGKNHLEVFAVKKDGLMAGAVGVMEFNGIIFQMASCQSNASYEANINVNDLLIWEIIRWGSGNRKRFYDLTGVPVKPSNRKEEGLLNFKMKWSRKQVDFDSHYKVYRKATHFALDMVKAFVA